MSAIINDYKTKDESKIQLAIAINVFPSRDSNIVYRKTNGLEIDCYVILFLKVSEATF